MSTIIVNKSTKITDIQDWFFATFEYLKLEFYKGSHQEFQGSNKNETINGNFELGAFGFDKIEYPFEIVENNTVCEVEEKFKKELHLNVQVFRKSAGVWLQTTSTDEWTLLEQIERAAYHEQD